MKRVYFSIREYPEVLALLAIFSALSEKEVRNIDWRVSPSPVNTDFDFLSLEKALYRNGIPASVGSLKEATKYGASIFGFKTDKQHDHDSHAHYLFDILELMATRLYRHEPLKVWNDEPMLVVGNIKIKAPVEEFQQEIFDKLARLPYKVVVVPRHPLAEADIRDVTLPKRITLVNTMGDLESLHAKADAVIMGRIFCAGDLVSDDDHNPFEATINANALAGINTNIPPFYKWIYNESGLIRQCASYDEVFDAIPDAINDGNIITKLARRREWILSFRERTLVSIREALSV